MRSCKYAVCCAEEYVVQCLCVSFYKGRIYFAVQTLYRCYCDALNTLISSNLKASPGGLVSFVGGPDSVQDLSLIWDIQYFYRLIEGSFTNFKFHIIFKSAFTMFLPRKYKCGWD